MSIRKGGNIIAGLPDVSGKANINLDNSTVITNCITKIPQDIKLELNNGTLTLKAGSKVYVPNGFESDGTTPKFDKTTIDNDLSVTRNTNTQETYVYRTTDNSFSMWQHCYSGTTAPSGETYMLWYDTASNKVKATSDGGSTWGDGFSLPVCLSTSNTTQITSIDQVFNGFGYIGSTIYALPGVEGLIPNGRNTDGSLNIISSSFSSVVTMNTVSAEGVFEIYCANNVLAQTGSTRYNKDENYNKDTSGTIVSGYKAIDIATDSSGKITSFSAKQAFHALDYNDSSTITSWIMPSSTATSLTVGASGSEYTAPANGWFYVLQENSSNGYLNLYNKTKRLGTMLYTSSSFASKGYIPVKKGDTAVYVYSGRNASSTINAFYFIYAQGEV